MQTRKDSGLFGPVEKFSNEGLQRELQKGDTSEVAVFDATAQQIKKHNKYRSGKKFQKVPKIK
jgi:hypothetical protein